MVEVKELERVRLELVRIHKRLKNLKDSMNINWDGSIKDDVWNHIFEAQKEVEMGVFEIIHWTSNNESSDE